MALFLKQDFSPPVLSRKWIAIKFRPNVLLYSREHVISILESGLLFREDSAEVEQECPAPEQVWAAAGGGGGGWLTAGERGAVLAVVTACVLAFPPKSWSKGTLTRLAGYVTAGVAVRAWHRIRARGGSLRALLQAMRSYLALARRAQACIRDNAVHTTLGSVSQALQSTHALLCKQQLALLTLMSRASAALLGNAPWLRADLALDSLPDEKDNLQVIHHTFLVVQSTLLKHIAMAHFTQPSHARAIYKNHNERVYWLHTVLIHHLYEEFKENYESLDRMYRIFKNYGSKDAIAEKRPGFAVNDRWVYSEVHSGIARACMDIKVALDKCTNLDMFLDSCAINDQELDLDTLNGDIDDLIEDLTKCLVTAQGSQIRLKKLQRKFAVEEERKKESEPEVEEVLKIDDKPPEIKDEVFYLLKTEDDDVIQPVGDVTTAPGRKEKEATKLVLSELRRKLVKREDVMRERERQALVKTMPELKDVPEFPRQIKMDDYVDRKGYIKKISKENNKDRLFKDYKISNKPKRKKHYKLKVSKYESESEIKAQVIEANANLNSKSKLISVASNHGELVVTEWSKRKPESNKVESNFSSIDDINETVNASVNQSINKTVNESVNNVVNESANQSVNHAVNKDFKRHDGSPNQIKFSKKDLELTPSSSESDFEYFKERQMLKDIRRHRVAKKKNHPVKRVSIDIVDESLKPIEYSFGTGMAMASVLQVNNGKMPSMAAEDVFIGDGEVSNDSGNDEDA